MNSSTQQRGSSHFIERQRFRQPWLWALLVVSCLGGAAPAIVMLYKSLAGSGPVVPPGEEAAAYGVSFFTALIMGGILWLMAAAELSVEVSDEALRIRFYPFLRREISYGDIVSAEARRYNPLMEYGGWGVKGFGRNRALNTSGDRGVQLVLKNGDRLLLGSQRADALALAINARLTARRP